MRRPAGRFTRDTRGSSAIEFALLAVPFLLLIFGSMEFARILWTREVLKQVATAGARCMGITQSECGTGSATDATMSKAFVVAEAARRTLTITATNVTVSTAATCGTVTGFSQVTLAYTYQPILPLLITALGTSVTLNASSCFPNQT
ncbi:MAG: pilus assembly protein TadE [Hyphomicrobiales bacterium]|nr:pilus assembly protein TadE [Hyphomicrobiales bacterium]